MKPCDDGNILDGDGCDSSCQVETDDFKCNSTLTDYQVDICFLKCGDGVRDDDEHCDNGGSNYDGCNTDCEVEFGYVCNLPATPGAPDDCIDLCGDGLVFGPQVDDSDYCDDGNKKNKDGCTTKCQKEYGWQCAGGSHSSKSECIVVCGDGEKGPGEQCDDRGIDNGDGCSKDCQVDDGYYCVQDEERVSKCDEICGDSRRMKEIGCDNGVCAIGTRCDDGNTQSGEGCSDECLVELGFTCSGGKPNKKDTCVEICGDGLDYEFNQCEDGNLIDDGCSRFCEFEECYECTGGTETTIDTCRTLHIEANMTESIPNKEYLITFDHIMHVTNIGLNDLSISVLASTLVDLDWTAEYLNETTLKMQVNIQSVLGGTEKLMINVINNQTIRGNFGGCVQPDKFTIELESSLKSSADSAASFGKFTEYFVLLGILSMFGFLLICGGSIEMIWSLINTLQLITYLPLMIPYYPDHVKIMFQLLKFVNMNVSFISNMFTAMIGIDGLDTEAYSTRFLNNGIDSPLFLQNCSSIIMSFLLTVIMLGCLAIIYCFACCKIVKNKVKEILSSYYWNNFLRFITEGYLEITFGALLNIIALHRSNMAELISLSLSILVFVPLFVFPFIAGALLYDKRKEIFSKHENYLKLYGTMYSNFKTDKEWCCFQYYPIFLVRRLVFVSFLICLTHYPEIQCNAFIVGSMLVSCFQILCKPFEDTIINWLCIFNESILFMISLTQTVFIIDMKNIKVVDITGWTMIGLVILMILLNFCTISTYTIYSKCKGKSKRKITPEEQTIAVISFRNNTLAISTASRGSASIREVLPQRRF